jgi:Secretion system C-terminal sorting domain
MKYSNYDLSILWEKGKMKTISLTFLFIFLFGYHTAVAQSIVIGSGASIYVPSGADICAGTYGNITGNIYGEGTQCTQTPVPVELTSFTAESSENEITLNWTTATELNNQGFEIERSSDNQKFEKIGFGAGLGATTETKSYTYKIIEFYSGTQYYRLKQIDFDGTYEYSDAIEVEGLIPGQFTLFQNYPNPFNPGTKIRYQLPQESKVIIKLYDILGAEVITLINEKKEAGVYEVDFNAQSTTGVLPSGIYIYRIVADGFVDTKKMILMK